MRPEERRELEGFIKETAEQHNLYLDPRFGNFIKGVEEKLKGISEEAMTLNPFTQVQELQSKVIEYQTLQKALIRPYTMVEAARSAAEVVLSRESPGDSSSSVS